MKKIFAIASITALCMLFVFSCKKEVKQSGTNAVPQNVIDKIHQLGFTTQGISRHEDGFLVEGDIVITENELNSTPSSQFLRIGEEEQYRTTNLVKSLPRTITVSLSSRLP